MKKTFIPLLFILFISTNTYSQNQEGVSGNIDVSATVIQSIELITVNTMTFGRVRPGQNEVYVNPIIDSNAGFLIAVGTPQAQFRIDYNETVVLTNQQETGRLEFIYEISRNDIEEQSTSLLIENQDETLRFNVDGNYYFWVGGRVNLENAEPGNYRGEFRIEIDYI